MKRLHCAGLTIEWDASELASDPFEPILPFQLEALPVDAATRPADLSIHAVPVARPVPSPTESGATHLIYHGQSQCLVQPDGSLILWDRASTLHVSLDGRRIEARVHQRSLDREIHFSSVTVMMTLLLALRSHGHFHLHAAGGCWDDGTTWVVPAESDAGKSTLSLAMFVAGARWMSDDAMLLRAAGQGEGAGIEVVGWTRPIRLTTRTAAAFPQLEPLLKAIDPDSKRDFELDPRRAFPDRHRLVAGEPLTLVFPRKADGPRSAATRLDRAEAFGRILHSCAWAASEQLPQQRAQLALLGRLVDAARAYDVAVGSRILSDPTAAVDEIRNLLS